MTARQQEFDLTEFEAWLSKQPRSVAAAIALRCSLRALPLLLLHLENDETADAAILKTFRQNNAVFAFVCSGGEFIRASGLTSVSQVTSSENPAVVSGYQSADSAFASPETTKGSVDPRFNETQDDAIRTLAIRATLNAIYIDSDYNGSAYEKDVLQLYEGLPADALVQSALWPDAYMPDDVLKMWEELKARLLEGGPDWDVWTLWYEQRLAGQQLRDLTLEIARIALPDPMWMDGASAVNPEIANLQELFDKDGPEAVEARMNELHSRSSGEETRLSSNGTQTEAEVSSEVDTSGQSETEETATLPRVWILQFNPEDWTSAPDVLNTGETLPWKTAKALPTEMQTNDPVIYWRTRSNGGLVGTGRVTSTELGTQASNDGQRRFETEVHEFDQTRLISRKSVIEASGITRKNWQGAVLALPESQALQLDAFLRTQNRPPLFNDSQIQAVAQSSRMQSDAAGSNSQTQADQTAKGTGQGDALVESETSFAPDDAETERDDLGRGILAIALARRLHLIWCRLNDAMWQEAKDPTEFPRRPLYSSAYWTGAGAAELSGDGNDPDSVEQAEGFSGDRSRTNTRAGFVLHLDAPWGGGKTTFANFLARVLNPTGYRHGKNSFLTRRYGNADLTTVFLSDPLPKDGSTTGDGRNWPSSARRPWIVVPFNAWQAQHVTPPWWVFYQSVRKRCFDSVIYEGWDPETVDGEPARKPDWWQRQYLRLRLWLPEIFWRLTSPKIVALISTGVVSLLLFWLLYIFGILELNTNAKGQSSLMFSVGSDKGFGIADGIGLMLTALTGLSFLWGIGACFTESIRPGTDTLAERLSLGNGDPFERFRRHFYKTMKRLKRPVLVVVDDLDRCSPEFIVDLVRGMQTLLRSPRVVFVILGDRDWIERAFEVHHKDMNKVSVGPEQTFGARFVEKAIQMSFILPGLIPDRQKDYVRRLLLGSRANLDTEQTKTFSSETTQNLRVFFQQAVQQPAAPVLDSEALKAQVRSAATTASTATDFSNTSDAKAVPTADLKSALENTEAFDDWFKDEFTIHAATDEEVEAEISHRLEPLADHLPANPRQIKRIINGVTMYNAVAFRQRDWPPDDERWLQLARWIVIMTEWPKTWRLLASYPSLTELLSEQNPKQAYKKLMKNKGFAAELPDSEDATLAEVERIKGDAKLLALLLGNDDSEELDRNAIVDLVSLTPLHSRAAEPEAPSAKKEADK
ncbi:P-loop NTPase fold protein [Roseibium porphyridii]|uniref:P-loop NTPase fold protein n=1 Tax=Roseibium porphyridii TaxID=2866279 RepID=A0ABY8F5L0_9HYPH|nr:P-loop NTPase fold protein [Roseibium sp. KMA01]WFE88565.1 P-loop NTPase fold protein [Roseibium sp. KMA01]